jgi:hypothetical protein
MANLKEAAGNAVTEMDKAADYIRSHPAAVNDPEFRAIADRLTAASQSLSSADVDQSQPAAGAARRSDTGSGSTSG